MRHWINTTGIRLPPGSGRVFLATPGGGGLPGTTQGHSGTAQDRDQGPGVQEEAQGLGD